MSQYNTLPLRLLPLVVLLTYSLTCQPLAAQSAPADSPSQGEASPDEKDVVASESSDPVESESTAEGDEAAASPRKSGRWISRPAMLVGSVTVFLLAVFVGFEIITKVPPTLHTPLMSGSNAISGITIVGAMLTAGAATVSAGSIMGMIAVVLAMVNVVGGFLVTHRMLRMFKKK